MYKLLGIKNGEFEHDTHFNKMYVIMLVHLSVYL
jgi:hypothetical protein